MSKDITDELIIREETSGYSFEKENSIEQDIEKVEKLIKKCDECKLNECINCEISWTEIDSVRRLIDRYKEQNDIIKTANIAIKDLQEKLENSIPVSLVEEKIEELDNQIKEVINNIENSVDEEKAYWKKEKHDLNMQRYVLQELLEKR